MIRFIILIVVMLLQVYTYVNIIKTYTLNTCSLCMSIILQENYLKTPVVNFFFLSPATSKLQKIG